MPERYREIPEIEFDYGLEEVRTYFTLDRGENN